MAPVRQLPTPTGLTHPSEPGEQDTPADQAAPVGLAASRGQRTPAEQDAPPGQGTPAECCTPLTRAPLSADDAERLVAVLKAVAVPARLRLLSMIYAHEGAEACVCELTGPLGLTQPTVSHHLKVLVDAGLLTRSKRGVWAYYRAVPDALAALAAVLTPPTT